MSDQNQLDELDGRARRIETRITRLMLALGVEPGHAYDLAARNVSVDTEHREVYLPNLAVTLLDCSNAVSAAGGDLRTGWSLVLGDRTMGTVTFAR